MAALKVSQKSLTKYSTLYRWNGHFGHLSEVRKNQKYLFWTFWTSSLWTSKLLTVMTLTINKKVCLPDPLNKVQI